MGHGVIWLIWTCYFILGVKCQDNGSTQRNATTLVQAEFGRSVVLPCNHQAQGRIRFMYMQTRIKPSVVVAGFHKQGMKNIDAKFKNRTKLGPNGTWVELSNVTINDKGDYECIIQTETEEPRRFTINLDVTARYSVPVLTAATNNESAGDRVSVASCSSSGGYPEGSIVWTLPPSSQWAEVNQSSVQNPVTKLFNVSSTIIINCSHPFKLSCRLGDTTSEQQEICSTDEPTSGSFDWILIIATVVAAILFITVVWMAANKGKECQGRTNTPDAEAQTEQQELETLT